jgi:RHS repeat-associated protein
MPMATAQSVGMTRPLAWFTGKERDAETGLDYFDARYFSGAQGRFTSPDRPQLDQHAEDPQSWNLYSYVRNNPLRFIDPTGTTLTVSQGWDQAQQDLCRILGGNQCADRISRNEKTGIVTVDLTGIDVSKNAGAKLLGDLTGSANTYDLAYGSTVETQGGQLNVTFIANLDGKPDWRYGKGKQPTDLPRAGVDGQIAFNWSNVTPTSTNSLLPAERYSVVFHELAEAFAKVDHGMPYMAKGVPRQGAHYDSMDREKILRRERPELLKHNIGAGPGTNYNVIQKTRRRP